MPRILLLALLAIGGCSLGAAGSTTVNVTATDSVTGRATVILVVRGLEDDDVVVFEYGGHAWILRGGYHAACEPLPPDYDTWKLDERRDATSRWNDVQDARGRERQNEPKVNP